MVDSLAEVVVQFDEILTSPDGFRYRPHAGAAPAPELRPVFNPFVAYLVSDEELHRSLAALDTVHLRDIIIAYGLTDDDPADLRLCDAATLTAHIITAVHERLRPE